jgi:LuxR family maltose regulon positive regulatory protein
MTRGYEVLQRGVTYRTIVTPQSRRADERNRKADRGGAWPVERPATFDLMGFTYLSIGERPPPSSKLLDRQTTSAVSANLGRKTNIQGGPPMPRRARSACNREILIRTKVTAPLSAESLVARPRLTGLLDQVARARITIVQAPAGYGKSTLLVQWYQALRERGESVGWLSLDAADRDARKLLAYVVAALETNSNLFDPSTQALMDAGPFVAPEVLSAAVINCLTVFERPVFLFLDDLHYLTEPAAQAALATLIDRFPDNAHVVAASREAPFLRLARTRARGQMLELDANALKFDRDEISSFLNLHGHSAFALSTLAAIEARTEGWVASLKLALLAFRGERDEASFLSLISGQGRSVAAFFVETVLARQSREMRDFLLTTSILDRLTADLCDAVTGRSDARAMIDQIEEMGLFLFSLDHERQWYRYHNLFSGFLRRRLADEQPGCEAVLHGRASDWFRAHRLDAEAFEHALRAGDPHRAANILDSCCHEMFYRGDVRTLADYASRLPADVLCCYPLTQLDLAWWQIVEWRFAEAEQLLRAVRARIDRAAAEPTLAPPHLRQLKLLLAHRQMMLDLFKDDVLPVEAPCRMLMREYRDADPYVAGSFYSSMIYAQRERYRLTDIDAMDAAARAHYERVGNPFAIVWHQSVTGPSRFLAGDPQGAIKALEEGMRVAAEFRGISALASVPALPLSEICYELNEIARAEELVEQYLPMASELGFVDQLTAGYTSKARLALLREDEASAAAALARGLEVARLRGFDRLRAQLVAERMRMLTQSGEVEAARDLAAAEDIVGPGERFLPHRRTTRRDEALAVAWVRLALMESRASHALALANAWQSFVCDAKATRSAVVWDVLRAKILLFLGERRAAQRALRHAVATAAPIGYVRSLLDEGNIVVELLEQMCATDADSPPADDAFIARLLGARIGRPEPSLSRPFNAGAGAGIVAALDAREREILGMVGVGLLNREIGQRLGLTEGTVKWYLQRIFDKLGIRRRSQAVHRARQFGLLA